MKTCLAVFLVCSLALASAPAFAAKACYSPVEMQAEQVLRLHSELMVVAIACRTGSGGEDLVNDYTGFTQHNLGTIRDAEQTMIRYYKAHGGDGIARLDTLRTRLGNEASQKMAQMTAPAFCTRYRDMVVGFYGASPAKVADAVDRMSKTATSYGHLCRMASIGQTRIAKNAH